MACRPSFFCEVKRTTYLTVGLVVITGVIGAVIGPSLFKLLRIRRDIANQNVAQPCSAT
ncbi:MAG: LrgB family protein [Candidatus Azotimanducaceae bacterium WSBS_2022_MAG_OTU7]